MAFVVGQQVQIVSPLSVGFHSGSVFVNSEMAEMAGSTAVVETVVEANPSNQYILVGCPYSWSEDLFIGGEVPVIVEVEEPEVAPYPFPVGTIVQIVDDFSEEKYGERLVNYGPGYVADMANHVGKQATVTHLFENSDYMGVCLDGIPWTWDDRSLVVVKSVEEIEAEKAEIRNQYTSDCIYRVYTTVNGVTTHKLSKVTMNAVTLMIDVTTCYNGVVTSYEPFDFRDKMADGSIRMVRVERND